MLPRSFAALLTLLCCLSATVRAAEPAKVEIGRGTPTWQALPGVDGRPHSLADLAACDVVVVAITCNHCPIAIEYYDRMKEFVRAHNSRVALVAISVSELESDSLERMQQVASRQELNFAYLHDASQQSARTFGATNTPHFFVLDQHRGLAYRGAWDDNLNASKVKVRYVEQAVDALLAGRTPAIAETKASGCPINFK